MIYQGYIQEHICVYDFVSKAIILLSRSSINVYVSYPYRIIERTSDLYKSIVVWMEILLLFHIVFNLTSDHSYIYLRFTLASLVKVTPKYLNL